jgi:RNA polymerase sigma-70 factor (ECF subfamily)
MNTAADTIEMPSGGSTFVLCRHAPCSEADAEDGHWSQLMARAQAGDRAAYDRLLRAIQPYIRAIVAAQHRPDRMEDVVQEVLLTVHRMRHTYDPARPFRPWLAAIARRRSIDALRRRYRSARFELSEPEFGSGYADIADPSSSGIDAAHAAADALGRAVALLPRQQREAIELLRLRELSLAEAAQTTGRSIAALKVNVHRALRSLRQQLRAD